MKKYFFSIFFAFVFCNAFAQIAPAGTVIRDAGDTAKYTSAEQMPSYSSDPDELKNYLAANIHYPLFEKERNIQGTVYVQFTVEKDGSVSNVFAVKQVACGPGLTTEAIRVITNMHTWIPGQMNGRPVRVAMTQPITFRLDDTTEPLPECGASLPKNDFENVCKCNPGYEPQYIGGDSALQKFVNANLKISKKTLKKNGMSPVNFTFIVDTSGSLVNIHVYPSTDISELKKNVGGMFCKMPKWKAGRAGDKKLNIQMSGKIIFEKGQGKILKEKIEFDKLISIPISQTLVGGRTASNTHFIKPQTIIKPTFPGGDTAQEHFIKKNLVYPAKEKKAGMSDTIEVSFIVESDGSITYPYILNEETNAPDFNAEAIRIVGLMPKWVPGNFDGRPVRMVGKVSIVFSLK